MSDAEFKLPSIHDLLAGVNPSAKHNSAPSPTELHGDAYLRYQRDAELRDRHPGSVVVPLRSQLSNLRPLSPPDSPHSTVSSQHSSAASEWAPPSTGSYTEVEAPFVPTAVRGSSAGPTLDPAGPDVVRQHQQQTDKPMPSLLSLAQAAATARAEQQLYESQLQQQQQHQPHHHQHRSPDHDRRHAPDVVQRQAPLQSRRSALASGSFAKQARVASMSHYTAPGQGHEPAPVANPSRHRSRTASSSSSNTLHAQVSQASREMLNDTTEAIKYKDPSGKMCTLTAKASTGKYGCTFCPKRFNRPSSLKIHLNTHTGSKPFQCPFPRCGRFFSVMSNMRRHQRNSHDPKELEGEMHTGEIDDDAEFDGEESDEEKISRPSTAASYSSAAMGGSAAHIPDSSYGRHYSSSAGLLPLQSGHPGHSRYV